jgi:hypothetical protein
MYRVYCSGKQMNESGSLHDVRNGELLSLIRDYKLVSRKRYYNYGVMNDNRVIMVDEYKRNDNVLRIVYYRFVPMELMEGSNQ